MRFLILGAGAIGGVVGARLHEAGHETVLITRGAHYRAIVARGLTLETPEDRVNLTIPVAPAPDVVGIGPDDIVLLATKSQDTGAALQALRDAATSETPLVCLQNGVENERAALRLFTHIYGGVVMAPTAFLEPGVVQAYGAALTGQIDIGCYPGGVDELCSRLCGVLRDARFDSEPRADIMRLKYAKLIGNLANAVQAICGADSRAEPLIELARQEGREVLRASGIEFVDENVSNMRDRWRRWGVKEIDGRPRAGGSTWQSVVRGVGSAESDYLNGEIVLQGRLTGVATPVNELLQSLVYQMVRESRSPGWLSVDGVLGRLGD